jgi:hypothetical protein
LCWHALCFSHDNLPENDARYVKSDQHIFQAGLFLLGLLLKVIKATITTRYELTYDNSARQSLKYG